MTVSFSGSRLVSLVRKPQAARSAASFVPLLDSSTEPVHVAAWVDDLIFIMATPEHSECAGFEGGCAVCGEYYGRALKVQEMWQAKARLLKKHSAFG